MALELYCKPACPYCKKVFFFMEKNNIQNVILKDQSLHPEFKDELIRIGGKQQVPCLVIDGKALYESDDIIKWMKGHLQGD